MNIIYLLIFTSVFHHYMIKYKAYYWLKQSFFYQFKKRQIDKLFDNLTNEKRRDLWLYSYLRIDEQYWFNRSLEKYIREKYIEPIIAEYGTV